MTQGGPFLVAAPWSHHAGKRHLRRSAASNSSSTGRTYSAFGAQRAPAAAWRKLTQRDSRHVGFTADAGRVPPAARHAGPVAPGTGRSDASSWSHWPTSTCPEPGLGRLSAGRRERTCRA
jgi:hypothetical protein